MPATCAWEGTKVKDYKTRHELVRTLLVCISVYFIFSTFFAAVLYLSIGVAQKLTTGYVDVSFATACVSGLVCTFVYLLIILASKDKDLSKD